MAVSSIFLAIGVALLCSSPITHGAIPSPGAFKGGTGKSKWHHGLFEGVRPVVQDRIRNVLHTQKETAVTVPLELNIVLVGFDGDGGYRFKLDMEALRQLLQRSYPTHRPACLETGALLEVEHRLTYVILSVGSQEMIEIERELRSAMTFAGERKDANGTVTRLYDVEATVVEPVVDRLYAYLFGQEATETSEKDLERPAPIALFVFNLDKARMDPSLNQNLQGDPESLVTDLKPEDLPSQERGYIYRYTYNGGSKTQVWVGKGRYAVMDLSAGPCAYGRLGAAEGAVGVHSLPRVRSAVLPLSGIRAAEPNKGNPSANVFIGHLSSVIISAIEHLFAPDVKFETLDITDRLLLAFIVLANHHKYNILSYGQPFSIDLKAIEAEVKQMLQPHQQLVVVAGTHLLHEHERIAMAVRGAMRTKAHDQLSGEREPESVRSYLDGSFMLEEMRHSADMLAAGLLEAAEPSMAHAFFDQHVPFGDEDEFDEEQHKQPVVDHQGVVKKNKHHSSLMPVKKDWQPRESVRTQRKLSRTMDAARRSALGLKDKKKLKSHGTRVVPVFILSLESDGAEPVMLLEDESQVLAAHDAVIVVQANNSSGPIPVSFVSESEQVHLHPMLVQRSIVAGLATVVGGLTSPFERRGSHPGGPREDWLWGAGGHHPFGPFSNTSSLSLLLQDTIRRNAIYSRVDIALKGVHESLVAIQDFNNEYLSTPFGDLVAPPTNTHMHRQQQQEQKTEGEALPSNPDAADEPTVLSPSLPQQWLDRLYNDPTKLFHPIPHAIVKRLHGNVREIEEQLEKVAALLYDHELKAGHEKSTDLLAYVQAFHEYVATELALSRDEMRCCQLSHRMPLRTSPALLYAGILAAGFLVYFLVIFFSSPH
eukprot:TRINITY_DN20905_c0_g1_i1.p1 TRINITY_DN20905_c0_g1~~TRINITY_DN20905_c0_g1_i1.p1  ORF type:complete len:878 (+),score=185.38 TRINITY_DN20905_c0_g1_i1:86-2719(+)